MLAAAAEGLPAENDDAENAARGFIGGPESLVIRDGDGNVVWDMDAYGFLAEADEAEPPDTVHPSLWRHIRIDTRPGLYEVAEGVYQVRGYDVSNMTLVEGEQRRRRRRPADLGRVRARGVRALHRAPRRAPGHRDGLLAQPRRPLRRRQGDRRRRGRRRRRRAGLRAGALPRRGGLARTSSPATRWPGAAATCSATSCRRGPRGQLGSGIGWTSSDGSVSLIPPTAEIKHTGQWETIDGVRFVFQLVPGDRGPGGAQLPPARARRPLRRRDRDRTPTTTSSPCAAPRCATRSAGRST